MKKNLIISYDLGTSGNKATLFDFDGNLIAKSFKSYKTFYNSPGFAEQSQKDWWQSVTFTTADLLQKVPNSAKNLCAVTFSGQMMGCCPIDNEGTPIFNAIIWSDQRSYKEKELLREKITDDFAYKKTGNIVCANYLATKVMWLKANYPEIYKKTFKFLQAKDYIAYLLTGKTYTDYSDASGTNLFDIENKKWCNEIINASGISLNKLPEIVPATTIIGKVRKDVAETIKLPAG